MTVHFAQWRGEVRTKRHRPTHAHVHARTLTRTLRFNFARPVARNAVCCTSTYCILPRFHGKSHSGKTVTRCAYSVGSCHLCQVVAHRCHWHPVKSVQPSPRGSGDILLSVRPIGAQPTQLDGHPVGFVGGPCGVLSSPVGCPMATKAPGMAGRIIGKQ